MRSVSALPAYFYDIIRRLNINVIELLKREGGVRALFNMQRRYELHNIGF